MDIPEELINYVSDELPSDGEWWDEANKEKFHKACDIMLYYGMNTVAIKEILADLYAAVASEYGS